MEFDFDSGIVGVREQDDLQWRAYQLKDVSITVSKAERLPHLPLTAKGMIFEDALQDREISLCGLLKNPPLLYSACDKGENKSFFSGCDKNGTA